MSKLHPGFPTFIRAHAQLVWIEVDAVLWFFPNDRKLNFMSTCVPYNQGEFVRIGGTYIWYNNYFGPQKRIVGKRVYVGETGEIM